MDVKEAVALIRKGIENAKIAEKKIEISEDNLSITFKDAGIDSLNAMCIIMEVEKIIKKRFSDEVLTSLFTLEDLTKAIINIEK